MGEPSLSESVLIVVNVRQVSTLAKGDGVGFANTVHAVQASEGAVESGEVRPLVTLALERLPAAERGLRVACQVVRAVDGSGRPVRGKKKMSHT
jgi:hypothetical protein